MLFLNLKQELRKSIVPSAAAYKLDKLMAAIETYQQRTRQKVPRTDHPPLVLTTSAGLLCARSTCKEQAFQLLTDACC